MALTLPQFHTSAYSHPLLTVHVPPSMDRRERRFQCEEPGCGKRFNRKFTLKEHMKTHTGARPYICDYEGCTSSFSTSGNLSRHKFTHTGEKPYGCTIAMCTKRFCTKEKLARHMKTHSGIRPFSCKVDGCHKKFSTSGNLGRHMKTHRSHVASSPSTQGSSGSEHHGQHELDHDIISALSSPGKQAAQQAKWKADKPRFPTIMRSQSDFSVRSFNTPNNMHIAVPQSSSSSAGRLQFNLFDSPLSTSNGSSSYSWPPAQFPSSTYHHHHHGGSYGSGLTITSQYQNSSNGGFKIEHDLLRDAIPQYEPLPFDRTGAPKISRSQSDGAVLGHSDLMNDFYYDH